MRSRDAVPQREGACRSGSTPGLVPRGQQGQGPATDALATGTLERDRHPGQAGDSRKHQPRGSGPKGRTTSRVSF